jgi:hypothetical protein
VITAYHAVLRPEKLRESQGFVELIVFITRSVADDVPTDRTEASIRKRFPTFLSDETDRRALFGLPLALLNRVVWCGETDEEIAAVLAFVVEYIKAN